MSAYCDCCVSDEQYVTDHLNWMPLPPLCDCETEAKKCAAFWESPGDPLSITVEELAAIFEKIGKGAA
jgi:hypothetical protein